MRDKVYCTPDMRIVKLINELKSGKGAYKHNVAIIRQMADLTLKLPKEYAEEWDKAKEKRRRLEDKVYNIQGIQVKSDLVHGGTPDESFTIAEWLDAKDNEAVAYVKWRDAVAMLYGALINTEMTDEAQQVWQSYYGHRKSMGQIAKLMNEDPGNQGKEMTKSRVQYLLNLPSNMEKWYAGYQEYLIMLGAIDRKLNPFYGERAFHLFEECINYSTECG